MSDDPAAPILPKLDEQVGKQRLIELAAAARADTLEEAAKVCDEWPRKYDLSDLAARALAAAIRALKEKPHG